MGMTDRIVQRPWKKNAESSRRGRALRGHWEGAQCTTRRTDASSSKRRCYTAKRWCNQPRVPREPDQKYAWS